jgi:hypothetical protein
MTLNAGSYLISFEKEIWLSKGQKKLCYPDYVRIRHLSRWWCPNFRTARFRCGWDFPIPEQSLAVLRLITPLKIIFVYLSPKSTSFARTTSFEPFRVQIGREMWSGRLTEKKIINNKKKIRKFHTTWQIHVSVITPFSIRSWSNLVAILFLSPLSRLSNLALIGLKFRFNYIVRGPTCVS